MAAAKFRIQNTPQLIVCVVLSALLFACAPAVKKQDTPVESALLVTEQDALRSIEAGRVLGAVRIYTVLAESSKDLAQRQDFELKAVEALFDAGYPELARGNLSEITRPSLTPTLAQRRRIVEARVAIALGDPEEALKLLPDNTGNLPVKLRVAAGEARAQAYSDLGDIENAVLARIALEQILSDESAIEQNHLQIWQMLDKLPDIQLAGLVSFGRGSNYQGWIELAQIVQTTRQTEGELADALPSWLGRFPTHPAASRFALLLLQQSEPVFEPDEQIALLLPLSGKLGEISAAVRDGFFAAYYADINPRRPDVRIYDTSDTRRNILEYYAQAVSDGAGSIVGPLDKAAIDQLATLEVLPKITLGLNYTLDSNAPTPENLFQFGLLPEDEARAAAEYAFGQGHTRAIALIPESAWGTRLLNAFNRRFVELGGTLLDYQSFTSGTLDFSKPIKRLLNLDRSRSRKKILSTILGVRLEFEPYRREDVEFIFLAAPAKLARQIKPQFKFHRGGNIPIYATSRAFSGTRDSHKDIDMDGLMVTDIPWLLSDAANGSRLYRRVNAYWPQQGSLARLYALGIDAYNLLPHLNELANNPDLVYAGRTGDLSITAKNRIRRHLQWARFTGGVPVKLPDFPQLENAVDAPTSDG